MANVLLIHGLGGFGWMMSRLAKALSHHGFHPFIWSYRSLGRSIQQHANDLQLVLNRLDARSSQLHLVTHSMGGIVARAALRDLELANAGRWVMLGPPNCGSAAARALASKIGFLCPALAELSDESSSFVNQLPANTQFETGILAAQRDRVVSLKSTHLDNERDHAIVPCRHGLLPFHSEAIEHTVAFLTDGYFLSGGRRLLLHACRGGEQG